MILGDVPDIPEPPIHSHFQYSMLHIQLPKSAYPSTVFLTLDIPVATSGKFFL
jgi:hypothetical protein